MIWDGGRENWENSLSADALALVLCAISILGLLFVMWAVL
jgi:hypothetical protein